MSNFGDWRKPGAAEAFEQAQLAKRMDAQTARPHTSPIIDEFIALGTPEGLAKVQKRMEREVRPAPAKARKVAIKRTKPAPRDYIGTTFIGVDPALRTGGFWLCIICRVDNTATFKSCKHLGEFVRILQDVQPAAVKVENSNLQKAMFDKSGGVGVAISVGKNMGVSQSAADIADQFSEIPTGISPKQKGAKITNEPLFQGIAKSNTLTLTNYKGGNGIGQDQRDTMMLALIAEQQYELQLNQNKK